MNGQTFSKNPCKWGKSHHHYEGEYVEVTYSCVQILSGRYLLNRSTFRNQPNKEKVVWWYIIMGQCHAKWLACYLQDQGHGVGWCNQKYYFPRFSTADPFVTELRLMGTSSWLLECLVKRLDCCAQGQGHSKGLHFQSVFVPTVSSELVNIF